MSETKNFPISEEQEETVNATICKVILDEKVRDSGVGIKRILQIASSEKWSKDEIYFAIFQFGGIIYFSQSVGWIVVLNALKRRLK